MKNLYVGMLFALLCSPAVADTPAGAIDTGFAGGVVDTAFDRGGSYKDEGLAMAQDSEGHLVIAGLASTDTGSCLALARYFANGARDPQFHSGGKGTVCHENPLAAVFDGSYQLAEDIAVAVSPTGEIYVAGSMYPSSGPVETYVCRFLPDGSLAKCALPEVAPSGNPSDRRPTILVHDIELLLIVNPDMVSGTDPKLYRLSLDDLTGEPPHDLVDGPVARVRALAADITDAGELLVAGGARYPGSIGDDFFVLRFDLDSNLPDESFGLHGIRHIAFDQGGTNSDAALAVRALSDGDVLVAGSIELATPNKTAIGVARLDASGNPVETFNNGAQLSLFENFDATIDVAGVDQAPSGKIVIAGTMDFSGAVIGSYAARLNTTGEPDSSFDEDGFAFHDISPGGTEGTNGMALQGERIVLGGFVSYAGDDNDFAIFRLSDGRLFNDGFETP